MQDRFIKDEDLFPNEAEATKLLSEGDTFIKGVEMVLGRPVDAKEFQTDETLRDLFHPELDGETRYALLLMKKSLDPKEIAFNKPTDL